MMDDRLPELVKIAKDMGYPYVFFASNGDFLTEELAAQLDGVVDYIGFAFYMDEPKKSERMAWVKTLFRKTKITLGVGDHMPTHFSPMPELTQLTRKIRDFPCNHPIKRMIVNHRGDMLMCCEDLTGNFSLGSVHDSSIEELWYSDRHQELVLALQKKHGRQTHPHCVTCPRQ
jgi:radical SAM protein with 4Fe4S-binding SPASM domain